MPQEKKIYIIRINLSKLVEEVQIMIKMLLRIAKSMKVVICRPKKKFMNVWMVKSGMKNVCIGLENTNKVADLIEEVNMPFQKPQLPTFPLPDGYKDNNEFLWHLIKQGWKDRGYDKLDEESQQIRKNRLNYEMGVIHSMGFDGYFLFVWDFIKAAEKLGIEVGKGKYRCNASFSLRHVLRSSL